MSPEPIQRRKLYREVLDRLMARINSGEFAPGETLPSERELMDAYKVGRPAIREALQQLERSGIVSISHGERARVVLPTAETLVEQMTSAARYLLNVEPRSLDHLKEARVFLEAGLARLAAERACANGLARLRQRLEEHRAASLDHDVIDSKSEEHDVARKPLRTFRHHAPDDFLKRDIAFHREIAVMSGNPIFPALVDGMLTWLSAYYRTLVRIPGAESLTLQEHQRILEAIAAGEADEAAQAMADHLNRANTLYRRHAMAPGETAEAAD